MTYVTAERHQYTWPISQSHLNDI